MKQPSGCEVRLLAGASPAVTIRSLTSLYLNVEEIRPLDKIQSVVIFAATSWRAC